MAEIWVLVEESPDIHDMVEVVLLQLVGHCFDGIHKGIHYSFGYFCDILAILIFFLQFLRIQHTIADAHQHRVDDLLINPLK
jgi:hypothetical protein